MSNYRILVVMTGGTIGSVTNNGVTDTRIETQDNLITEYEKIYHSGVDFEVIHPYNLLSENLTPEYWEVLHQTIKSIDLQAYHGIILTHGSDTLSYTSAMCTWLFRHLRIPFVLTASNYPPSHEKSNALDNFHTCVTLIISRELVGVFTVYENDRGENDVYLSDRIEEADVYYGRFKSFGGRPIAKRNGDKLIYTREGEEYRVKRNAFREEERVKGELSFYNQVLILQPYPGFCYDNINLSPNVKAVMICLYHSSTTCVEGKGYSAVEFIKKCNNKGVDVYLYYLKSWEEDHYVTTEELLKAGAVPIKEMSKEMAYTSLLLDYNPVKNE